MIGDPGHGASWLWFGSFNKEGKFAKTIAAKLAKSKK